MMSDVLAFSKDHLQTSDRSVQSAGYPTAEMLDIVCIIFVRGKKPDESMLEMARTGALWSWKRATICSPPAVCCTRLGCTAGLSDAPGV